MRRGVAVGLAIAALVLVAGCARGTGFIVGHGRVIEIAISYG